MIKVDKTGMLKCEVSEMLALKINLFRGYVRKFGGDVVNYETSKKYFLDELNGRPWFAKLDDRFKENFVSYILKEYSKGFVNEVD